MPKEQQDVKVLRVAGFILDRKEKVLGKREIGKVAYGHYYEKVHRTMVCSLMRIVQAFLIEGKDGLLIPLYEGKKIVAWVLTTKAISEIDIRNAAEEYLHKLAKRRRTIIAKHESNVLLAAKREVLPVSVVNKYAEGVRTELGPKVVTDAA